MSIHNTYKGWRTSIIGVVFLLFVSCNVENTEKYIPNESVDKDSITILINQKRNDLNLKSLINEKLLIELSKEKVLSMEKNKEINHNGFTSLQINTEIYGQVVGCGYKNNSQLVNAYLSSKEHSQILLGNFTHIGNYKYKNYNCILFAKY